jgi:hypothetical protein
MARSTSSAARALAALVIALVASIAGGCEFVVPADVPSFECDSNYSNTCPPGQTCNPRTHLCGPMTDDGGQMLDVNEASDDGDAMPMETGDEIAETGDDISRFEGGDEDSGGCHGFGCLCAGNSQCDTHLCADTLAVGGTVVNAAGGSFCSKACCTSADCDANTVCYGTGTGSYCVTPTWIGRSGAVGTGKGGDSCGGDGECRSGLCNGTTCEDTCCSAYTLGECSGTDKCRYGTFPGKNAGDQAFTPHCAPGSGTNAPGDACSGDSSCASDLCVGNTCMGACRNSADCASIMGYCFYVMDTNMHVFDTCLTPTGMKPMGAPCAQSSECATGACGPSGCTDPCASASDCSGVPNWYCRPDQFMVMGQVGKVDILVCGP